MPLLAAGVQGDGKCSLQKAHAHLKTGDFITQNRQKDDTVNQQDVSTRTTSHSLESDKLKPFLALPLYSCEMLNKAVTFS